MAIQYVNVGAAPNDHTGDPLRDAFIKINSNFAELDGSLSGMQISITNIEGDIVTIQSDITTIEGNITTIEGDITTIQGDITTIQSDIDNLQLDSLTDVEIISPLNEDVLTFESSTGLWKNMAPTGGSVAPGVLKTLDGLPLDATLKIISDNTNVQSPLILSTTSVTNFGAGVGIDNTAFGSDVLTLNTNGTENAAFGYRALFSNIGQNFVPGIGQEGSHNTAFGYKALELNTIGQQNTAVGNGAMQKNTSAKYNTAVGIAALLNNQFGEQNVAIGAFALYQNVGVNGSNVQGHRSVAIGSSAMQNNTTGNGIAVGNHALLNQTTGAWNICMGSQAGSGISTGSNNVVIAGTGFVGAGGGITTGSNNLIIGPNNGNTTGLTTGSGNVIIGKVTGLAAALANSLILSNGIGNIRLSFDSAGQATWTIAPTTGLGTTAERMLVRDTATGLIKQIAIPSGGGTANLGYTPAPTQGTITNSAGTPAIIPLADNINAGLLSPTDLAKINTAIQTIVPGTNIAVNNADPINPIVSGIPATSAGVFDRVYLTGQVASVATPVGPNYDSIRNGKGSVALVGLIAAGLNASTKVYIPNDIVGPAYPVAATLPLGNYTGFLSVQASSAIGLKRFTIEVFLCDNAGDIISSSGPVSGSTDPFYAGKNTITILDSGDINLANDDVTQIGLSGYLANSIPVAIGQRFRFHISVARGADGGGLQTMTVNIGNNANSYVEAPVPITTSTVINVSNVPGATATDALNALTQWRGNWVAGTYQKNQQVLDNSFLAIANKVTTDRPAPQPIGTPGYIYGAPTIPTTSVSAKQVIFGNRYNFQKDVIVEGWRVNVVAGNSYGIYLVQEPTGAAIITQVINYTSQRSGWVPLSVPKTIIKSGSTYDLVVTVSEPEATSNIFTANYDYKKPTNFSVVNPGDFVQANTSINTLRISKTDANAIDRTAQLAALGIGDIIIGDATRWAIQSTTDSGTYFTFVVSPPTQITGNGLKTFTFEATAATPITYPVAANYWFTNPPVGITVQGLLAIDATYISIVPNTSAYGADLIIQEVIPSLDWDIQAFSETSASNDGGSVGKRTETIPAAATSYTLNCDSFDVAQTDAAGFSAATITFNTPTGTPTANQFIMYHIKDNGVLTTLNFTTSTAFIGTADFGLPTTTILGKWMKILFIWNSVLTKWECVSIVNSL